jgi:predicted  nucleic acid-binding Zn-ribbon protein
MHTDKNQHEKASASQNRATLDGEAEIMRLSALQDAKIKRWQGWQWKDYQTSITRQNYKLRDAEALAEACRDGLKFLQCAMENLENQDAFRKTLKTALEKWEEAQ